MYNMKNRYLFRHLADRLVFKLVFLNFKWALEKPKVIEMQKQDVQLHCKSKVFQQ